MLRRSGGSSAATTALVVLSALLTIAAGCDAGIVDRPLTPAPTSSASLVQSVVPAAPTAVSEPPADTTLESLWALISDPDLSYHLSGGGLSKNYGKEYERFSMELDIAGDDYAGPINSTFSGKATLVRKDGVMYVRQAGHRNWVARRVPTSSLLQFVPFLDIRQKADLQPDGVQKDGWRTLYRYVSTDRYAPDVAHMMDLSRFSARCDPLRLELLVTDAGVPVRAHFACRVGTNTYSGTSDYKFTHVGDPFSIKPPVKPPQ